MFSQNYEEINNRVRAILKNVELPSPEEVKIILSQSKEISLDDLARLLEIGKNPETEEQFKLVRNYVNSKFRREVNTLRHISPIYLSSHCIDSCGYCNYSATRKDVQRTRLSISDLEKEVITVINEGNNVIEFTLATDPSFTSEKLVKYIAKTKELLRGKSGSGILLCSDYFSIDDYEKLKKAGLWGMVQWDETLDKDMYEQWHDKSKRKSNFNERIDNHDRAIKAGLQVATGCLFGLSDYSYDVLMQIAKSRYLGNEYGVKPFVFGTPRLKSIAGISLHPKTEVDDFQYELSLMVLKIGEPQVSRWLQTRESSELNFRNILDGDVYTYRCGDVKPGGYKVNEISIDSCKGGQFMVSEMTKEEFEGLLKKVNFRVDYSWIK